VIWPTGGEWAGDFTSEGVNRRRFWARVMIG